MRCFTFADGKIFAGIRFQRIEWLKIAGQTVGFDESLIFDPTSHFGQYIIRASVRKQGDQLSLVQAAGETDGVLLFASIPVCEFGELTFRGERPGITKHIGEIVTRFFHSGDCRYSCPVFEALIEFNVSGAVVLVQEVERKLTRVQTFVGLQPEDPITRKVRFEFDGEKIRHDVIEPEGTRPRFKNAPLNLYDGLQTMTLIREMTGL